MSCAYVEQTHHSDDLLEVHTGNPDGPVLICGYHEMRFGAPPRCRDCGELMHDWSVSKGEPGTHLRCDCGTTLFVLADSGDDEPEEVLGGDCGHPRSVTGWCLRGCDDPPAPPPGYPHYAECPTYPGRWFNKSTGGCDCGSAHSNWQPTTPRGNA